MHAVTIFLSSECMNRRGNIELAILLLDCAHDEMVMLGMEHETYVQSQSILVGGGDGGCSTISRYGWKYWIHKTWRRIAKAFHSRIHISHTLSARLAPCATTTTMMQRIYIVWCNNNRHCLFAFYSHFSGHRRHAKREVYALYDDHRWRKISFVILGPADIPSKCTSPKLQTTQWMGDGRVDVRTQKKWN